MKVQHVDRDSAQLEALGYHASFDRRISLWENFALGFTYLSPVVGVYSVFDVGMSAGGPPMIWAYPLAGLGQFLVCLVFCEVVSQFPISGGLYPWARRLVGKRWAWMAGWLYGWALFISIAAVASGAAPFLAPLLGFDASPGMTTGLAIALVALSTLLNLAGTKLLARVAMFGFVCEILGAVVVGVYLLIFHRHHGPAVLLQSFGLGTGLSYLPAFAASAVVGLFTCYGFEACGDVAEETPNPGSSIPRAMRSTIYVGMAASIFVCAALIMAVPDIAGVVSGKVANPIELVLGGAFGPLGARGVVAVVMVSFLSCILSLQAAASRLVHAYARDRMVAGSAWLDHLSPSTHVPARALAVSGAVGSAILLLGLVFQDAVGTIVSFAVIGIYAAFQMVVIGALYARAKGWRPSGSFRLKSWAWPVNVLALVWGIGAILDMLWPRAVGEPWYVTYAMAASLLCVLLPGLIYMIAGRPYDRGTSPAGSAWHQE